MVDPDGGPRMIFVHTPGGSSFWSMVVPERRS